MRGRFRRLENSAEASQDVVDALHNLNFSVQSVERDDLVESVGGFADKFLQCGILLLIFVWGRVLAESW